MDSNQCQMYTYVYVWYAVLPTANEKRWIWTKYTELNIFSTYVHWNALHRQNINCLSTIKSSLDIAISQVWCCASIIGCICSPCPWITAGRQKNTLYNSLRSIWTVNHYRDHHTGLQKQCCVISTVFLSCWITTFSTQYGQQFWLPWKWKTL